MMKLTFWNRLDIIGIDEYELSNVLVGFQ